MKATDQQAKGSQAQALPGVSQATPPAGEQTPPGSEGGEPGIKLFTQEEADAYAEKYMNKTHGKLRTQMAGQEKWLNLLAYEHPKLQARTKELEDLIQKYEGEGEKKNPDLAELNRMKREVEARARELIKREEVLRFSEAEHAEDVKAVKAYKIMEQVAEVAKEFGIEADDLMAANPTSEEQMRAIAETLNKRSKAADKTKSDSGVGSGTQQDRNIYELPMDAFSQEWRKKHPIKK